MLSSNTMLWKIQIKTNVQCNPMQSYSSLSTMKSMGLDCSNSAQDYSVGIIFVFSYSVGSERHPYLKKTFICVPAGWWGFTPVKQTMMQPHIRTPVPVDASSYDARPFIYATAEAQTDSHPPSRHPFGRNSLVDLSRIWRRSLFSKTCILQRELNPPSKIITVFQQTNPFILNMIQPVTAIKKGTPQAIFTHKILEPAVADLP